jgi:hypothetical protein
VISRLRPPLGSSNRSPNTGADLQEVDFQGGFQARHEKVVSSRV